MAKGFRAPQAVILPRVGGAGLIFIGLIALASCQGFSSGKPAVQQQQSGVLVMGSASLDFGSVTEGASKTLTTSISNAGTTSVTISSIAISSRYFSLTGPSLPVTIAAGQNSTISLVFTPNAAGAFSAIVSLTCNASNVSTTLSLSGAGLADGQLAVSPTTQSFGSVAVGSQSTQTVTLTNNGASTVNLSQVSVTGTGFKLSGVTTPIALNTSQSTTFTVAFAPQSIAAASGSVTIQSNASNPMLTIPLSGTGVAEGALGSSSTSLAFGSLQVGKNEALSETVTNTGGSSLTISQVGISGTGFTLSGITTPLTLAAGQGASFSVSFTPASAGNSSGNLTITSNG
ncbi:MAG: choice-of-anchor D domain-containing protein, partial [Candidatus Sulfotelmatobacter sp.]